jgi:hypothetical protein
VMISTRSKVLVIRSVGAADKAWLVLSVALVP